MFIEFQEIKANAEYYRLRGDCYLALDKLDEAILDLKTATSIDEEKPRGSETRIGLVTKWLHSRNIDEIIDGT